MWQLDNRTPFAAAQGWIRDREGAEVWLAVVKATFDVLPGQQTAVCAEQPEPLRLPQHHGEAGKSSIRIEQDFVLTKATTDVIVAGHAHAPDGQPVRQMDVGFRVGELRKLVRVFGDRAWSLLGGPGEPLPFVSMPLVYERAFGGADPDDPQRSWEWRNPVGCGFATRADQLPQLAVPNVEDPDQPIRSWSDRPPPAGFGPIASHWQPRASLAGTYDAHWEATRQPLLAEDCDDRFFQCAPADQQAARFLEGGEPVTWLGLSPRGRVDFPLPRMALSLESRFSDGERRTHEPPRLHTVIFEPDLMRVALVWHSALECHAKVHKLDMTRITWTALGLHDNADEPVENLLELI